MVRVGEVGGRPTRPEHTVILRQHLPAQHHVAFGPGGPYFFGHHGA